MQRNDKIARGRGAGSNPPGRFEPLTAEAVDDGWPRTEEAVTLRTETRAERPRRVITRNASPDLGFDRSINPFRGCEHGCIYCFARPTHAYLGLSPGLDFETRLVARPEAPEVLRQELSQRPYIKGLFWDQATLYQKPRTDAQEAAFKRALEVMMDLYASAVGTTCVTTPTPSARPS